jgi:hypothetical protein
VIRARVSGSPSRPSNASHWVWVLASCQFGLMGCANAPLPAWRSPPWPERTSGCNCSVRGFSGSRFARSPVACFDQKTVPCCIPAPDRPFTRAKSSPASRRRSRTRLTASSQRATGAKTSFSDGLVRTPLLMPYFDPKSASKSTFASWTSLRSDCITIP